MKINKYILNGLFACSLMLFASCGAAELELGDSTTPALDPNISGIEFSYLNPSSVEVPADAPAIDVIMHRTKADDAATFPVTVVSDASEVFEVPASVSFDAGKSDAILKVVLKETGRDGDAHELKLAVDETEANPYTMGTSTYTVKVGLQWKELGVGYWYGNIVNVFYGVNALPLVVNIETIETPNAIKFRFASPYALAGEEDNGIGYLQYPYNAKEDLTGNGGTFVITVTEEGASLAPVNLGFDWGNGEFSTGSIYGNLSTNIEKYPLGTYVTSETGGYIYFPAASLYGSMADYNDGGKYPTDAPSFLFLSADDFLAAMGD